jgi:hypothetical protein
MANMSGAPQFVGLSWMRAMAASDAAPGRGQGHGKEQVVDETLFTLHLRLTQPEITSLLMAQITQTRLSRLTFGEVAPITCVDRAVLEKLVRAQQLVSLEKAR